MLYQLHQNFWIIQRISYSENLTEIYVCTIYISIYWYDSFSHGIFNFVKYVIMLYYYCCSCGACSYGRFFCVCKGVSFCVSCYKSFIFCDELFSSESIVMCDNNFFLNMFVVSFYLSRSSSPFVMNHPLPSGVPLHYYTSTRHVLFVGFSIKECAQFSPVSLGVPFLDSTIYIDSNVWISDPILYYPTWCFNMICMYKKVKLVFVGHPGIVSILFLWYTNKLSHPLLFMCLGPSSIFVSSPHYP